MSLSINSSWLKLTLLRYSSYASRQKWSKSIFQVWFFSFLILQGCNDLPGEGGALFWFPKENNHLKMYECCLHVACIRTGFRVRPKGIGAEREKFTLRRKISPSNMMFCPLPFMYSVAILQIVDLTCFLKNGVTLKLHHRLLGKMLGSSTALSVQHCDMDSDQLKSQFSWFFF